MSEPTPVPTLLGLADRCEAASGPNREMDIAIWACVNPSQGPDPENVRGDYFEKWTPRYTASLDAALSLVPEGYVWGCGFSRYVPHDARVSSSAAAHGQWIGHSDHSKALALCAAALRARAALAAPAPPWHSIAPRMRR